MPIRADTEYLLSRAEAELEIAQQATHEGAVRSHYLLAGLYLDRVYGGDSEDAATTQLARA